MSQTSKRILGLDPGLTHSGYGIVEVSGNRIGHVGSGSTGPVEKARNMPDRVKLHFDGLIKIIEEYRPDEIALEAIFYARNVKMAIELSHIRGALILAGKLKGLPVYEYSPLEIKQSAVGYGKADKNQVHKMVKTILKNPKIKDSHASDALAAAICHANSSNLSSKIRNLMT